MQFANHFLFSLLLSLIGVIFFVPPYPLAYVFVGVLVGIFADIDLSHSTIGKKVKVVGWLFDHRGIFHSVLTVGLLSFVVWLFTGNFILVYFVFVPFFGHLILDGMTKSGVMLWYPFSKKKMRGWFKTGSLFDRLLQAFWLFCVAFFLLRVMQLYS